MKEGWLKPFILLPLCPCTELIGLQSPLQSFWLLWGGHVGSSNENNFKK